MDLKYSLKIEDPDICQGLLPTGIPQSLSTFVPKMRQIVNFWEQQ